jgi:hypothetical protein
MNKILTLLIGLFLTFSYTNRVHAQTWEVYDTNFNLKSRLLYDQMSLLSETVKVGKRDSVLYLLSTDLEPAVSLEGNEIYQYRQPWILVKGQNGIGAFHEYGQKVMPLEYDDILTYFTYLLARKGNEYWVYQRGKNKILPLGKFDEVKITFNGILLAKRGDEYVLPLSPNPEKIYQLLSDNDGEYILAKEPSGYGIINLEGDYVMEPIIDTLLHTEGNFFYGYDENQYLLIEGKDIDAQIRYNSFHKITFENEILLEYIHGKLRRVMKEDGILLDAVGLVEVSRIGKDLYNVRFRDNKLGLLGKSGWLVKPMLDIRSITNGSEGLYPVQKDQLVGFADREGNWIIDPKFTEVQLFSENIGRYRITQDWGLIGNKGEMIGTASWSEIRPFLAGVAIAKQQDKFFLLNQAGTVITEMSYDDISRTEDGYFLVEKLGKSGLLDKTGKELIPPDFDFIRREKKDFLIVRKDSLTGVINESGEALLPLAYQDVIVDWANGEILTKNLYNPILIQEVEEPSKKRKNRD